MAFRADWSPSSIVDLGAFRVGRKRSDRLTVCRNFYKSAQCRLIGSANSGSRTVRRTFHVGQTPRLGRPERDEMGDASGLRLGRVGIVEELASAARSQMSAVVS